MADNHFAYDFVVWVFTVIFDLFFREILPRGAYRIPKTGPVIFVGAPHANQFIDPMILMQQARYHAGRRISFLVAERSLKRKFIGSVARLTSAIGVVRAQDNLKPGSGIIRINLDKDPLRVFGQGTKFTSECMVGGLIGLPGGNSEISEVVSDTEIVLRKEFKGPKPLKALQQPEGTKYKVADHVNQSTMYHKVFSHLHKGDCIGIFPEGGSHDRTDLLPLKAGVAIMALGALAEDDSSNVKIVPCGMNYFHPHKFRSRAVIEFGPPMEIPRELVEAYKQGGDKKREAVKKVLDLVTVGLKAVTVTCPDYDTLMTIQAARRLYHPPGKRLSLPLTVELTRRLIEGYIHYKDHPAIIHLKQAVASYNKQLRNLGIKDHQVETATLGPSKVIFKFIYRLGKLLILLLAALPGTILFSPIFVATKVISRKKAAEALRGSTVKVAAKDVVATWKILVAIGLAPLVYTIYALVAAYLCCNKWGILDPSLKSYLSVIITSYIVLPPVTYAALAIGETGMDIFKSLRPLELALDPSQKNTLEKLRNTRRDLVVEITEVVNTLGPSLYNDFDKTKIINGKPPENEQRKEEEDSKPKVDGHVQIGGTNGYEFHGRQRSDSSLSKASTESNAISRVTSEADLSNIPLFSNDYSTTNSTSSHSRQPSDGIEISANSQKQFQDEVSKRIRGAMALRQRSRKEAESEDEDEE